MKPNYLDNGDLEFRDLVKVEDGDSGDPPIVDCMHPRPMFCEATDDLEKFFQASHTEQELQKNVRDWRTEFLRSISRKPELQTEPQEQSCEEFFDCEKAHRVQARSACLNGSSPKPVKSPSKLTTITANAYRRD